RPPQVPAGRRSRGLRPRVLPRDVRPVPGRRLPSAHRLRRADRSDDARADHGAGGGHPEGIHRGHPPPRSFRTAAGPGRDRGVDPPRPRLSDRRSASLSRAGITLDSMPLPLPTSLSPSKVASFKDCALAFRFSAIDRPPEPPSPWAVKGTLVHRALELLFWEEQAGNRSLEAALTKLERARVELHADAEFVGLGLS